MNPLEISQPNSQPSVPATQITGRQVGASESARQGLTIQPIFCPPDLADPFDSVPWEQRTATIKGDDGQVLFEQHDCEIPASWSQLATNVVASKYFYGEVGTPRREKSVRQLIHRVARTIADWGLADGYFVLPYTIGGYLAQLGWDKTSSDTDGFKQAVSSVKDQTAKFLSMNGNKSPDDYHMELGKLMLEKCGMARNEAGLKEALKRIPEIRAEFWSNLRVTGSGESMNQTLEKAGRVADFLEFGELMCRDALMREESCGGHFREEHQTPEGEALRHDDKFSFVGAWEFKGVEKEPQLHKEELNFEIVKPSARSYK